MLGSFIQGWALRIALERMYSGLSLDDQRAAADLSQTREQLCSVLIVGLLEPDGVDEKLCADLMARIDIILDNSEAGVGGARAGKQELPALTPKITWAVGVAVEAERRATRGKWPC